MKPRPADQRLFDELARGVKPAFVLRTGTRVDVGWWWRRARVGVGCVGAELVLFAAGTRPYVERAPLTELRTSSYNAVTGEVMLAPAPNLRQRRLKLAPLEGRQLLAHIQEKEATPC